MIDVTIGTSDIPKIITSAATKRPAVVCGTRSP